MIPKPLEGLNYTLVEDWTFGTNNGWDIPKLREQFFTRYIWGDAVINKEWQTWGEEHFFEPDCLVLPARPKDGINASNIKAGSVLSAMIRSKALAPYGYFECTMQVPKGRGMWPAFWLLPERINGRQEIDFVEIVNNGIDSTKNSFCGLITNNQAGAANPNPTPTMIAHKVDQWASYHPEKWGPYPIDFSNGPHTFSGLWTENNFKWFVDGVLIREAQNYVWLDKDNNPAGDMHLLVNLAIGGDWSGAPIGMDFPAYLKVYNIRVWRPTATPPPPDPTPEPETSASFTVTRVGDFSQESVVKWTASWPVSDNRSGSLTLPAGQQQVLLNVHAPAGAPVTTTLLDSDKGLIVTPTATDIAE